jgi:uncharacterized membrane protein YhhN
MIAVGVTLMGVVGLVVAEHRESKLGVWIAKPVASLAFVAIAMLSGAGSSVYGQRIVAALVLSMVGDVLLIPRGELFFMLGLGSFLLGHVAFAAAFASIDYDRTIAAVAFAVVAALAVVIARWLWPHVPAKLRVPVLLYIGVITVMVSLAIGTAPTSYGFLTVPGAVAFFLSDLSVARDRFVSPGFTNRLWGLPLYYLAQVLLALSVRGI